MNINGVSLACLNARGIMSGALYVDHIISKYNIDIFAFSEHWFFSHSPNFLGSINVNYENTLFVTLIYATPMDMTGVTQEGGWGRPPLAQTTFSLYTST